MKAEVVADGQKSRPELSRYPHWSYWLLLTIIVVVFVSVSLLLLPFLLRDDYSFGDSDPLSCVPAPYTGSMCLRELSVWQSCLPEVTNTSMEVFIPFTVDQELAESQAAMLFAGLELVGTGPECETEFRSFWCLLLFGVCDGNGKSRLPSFELCHTLQTITCFDLIQFAASVPEFSVVVQNCNNFRFGQPPTCRNESVSNERRDFNVSCSDGFFYDDQSLTCRPICGEWTPLFRHTHTILLVLLIAGDVWSILICTAVIILSFIQHKLIFRFPSVLIVYPTVMVLVVSLLDLVSFLPVNSFLCSSRDLLEHFTSGDASTPLCMFQGGLFLYGALVVTFFWLFQTAIYFWVVIFPIHYRSYSTSGKLRTIHLTSVVLSLTVPLIPTTVIYFDGGFVPSLFVPNKCIPMNIEVFFYSFSAPFALTVMLGISFLIATIWKVANIKECLQRKSLPRGSKLKVTEIKLIILIVTYTCVALQTTLSSNITLSHVAKHMRELESYFVCESLGDPTMQCSWEGFSALNRESFVQTFVYIIFNIYPAIFFVFLVSPNGCSRLCGRKKDSSEAPTNSGLSSNA